MDEMRESIEVNWRHERFSVGCVTSSIGGEWPCGPFVLLGFVATITSINRMTRPKITKVWSKFPCQPSV